MPKPAAAKSTRSQRHPIIEMIGDVPIRRVNYLSFYFDERAMKIIARLIAKVPKLSAAKIVALSSQPCECCKGKKIMMFVDGKVVLIPRGLLSTKRENNGSNISKKKRNEQTTCSNTPVKKRS